MKAILAAVLALGGLVWAADAAQAQVYSSPFLGTYTVNPYPVLVYPYSYSAYPRGWPIPIVNPPFYWYGGRTPNPGLPMYGVISTSPYPPYPLGGYPYGSFYLYSRGPSAYLPR